MTTLKVLFVCQSNSGLSQMADGLMRQLSGAATTSPPASSSRPTN